MSTGNQPIPVPCPCCSYDLRGVPTTDGLYRCPECGNVSNLRQLTRARRTRDHTWWRWAMAALVLAIALLMILMASNQGFTRP